VTLRTFRLFAPLSNATGHYLSIRLAAPFRIEAWTKDQIIRTWRIQEGVPKFHAQVRFDDLEIELEKGRSYVVTARVRLDDADGVLGTHNRLDALTKRLDEQMRALTLYIDTDVGPHDTYWYYREGKDDVPMGSYRSPGYPKQGREHVWPRDIPGINAFIRRTRFPLKHDYIELAWEHYEQSMASANPNLELLSLVMALEALFNVGQTDLRYRVSRAVAVLLGTWMHTSEAAFDYVGKAYDLRSKLVHTGKADLKGFYTSALRGWVQRAILKLIEVDLPKATVAEILTRLPFGQGDDISRKSKKVLLELERNRRWKKQWTQLRSK
jgi:hypothetical protein